MAFHVFENPFFWSKPGRSEMLLKRAHPCPVGSFFVEMNLLFNPIQISLFSFSGIQFQAYGIVDTIKEYLGFRAHFY